MPAYNAERTLPATVQELPEIVDIRILVDDFSAALASVELTEMIMGENPARLYGF